MKTKINRLIHFQIAEIHIAFITYIKQQSKVFLLDISCLKSPGQLFEKKKKKIKDKVFKIVYDQSQTFFFFNYLNGKFKIKLQDLDICLVTNGIKLKVAEESFVIY